MVIVRIPFVIFSMQRSICFDNSRPFFLEFQPPFRIYDSVLLFVPLVPVVGVFNRIDVVINLCWIARSASSSHLCRPT